MIYLQSRMQVKCDFGPRQILVVLLPATVLGMRIPGARSWSGESAVREIVLSLA